MRLKSKIRLISLISILLVTMSLTVINVIKFKIKYDIRDQAAENKNVNQQASSRLATDVEFASDEILVKVKKQAANNIRVFKNGAGNISTGTSSLDSKLKENKVKSMEKVVKTTRTSNDAAVFLWYKVTIDTPRKTIRGSLSQTSGEKDQGVLQQKQTLTKIMKQMKEDPSIEAVEPSFLVTSFASNHLAQTITITKVPTPTLISTITPTPTTPVTLSPTTANPTLTPPPGGTNDPYYSSIGSWGQTYPDLWGIRKINPEPAWQQTTGSDTVIVAAIDSGADRNHEDLNRNMWVNVREISNNNIDDDQNGYIDDYYGWDFANNDNDPMDDYGHGTHTVGTISGVGDNGIGIAGVSWKTKIMALKFLNGYGQGSTADAVAALTYAADMGARISSNSWGCSCYSQAMVDALQYEYDKGMVIVTAAGNSDRDALNFSPASFNGVVTVAASDTIDAKASFSNWGEKIDVIAPGVDILSTKSSQAIICTERIVGTNYCRMSGTSMATPHVAGLTALLLLKNPSLSNEQIRQIIRKSSVDLGVVGKDKDFGYGRIDVGNSMNLANSQPLAPVIQTPNSRSLLRGTNIQIIGKVPGANFASYTLELGEGRSPVNWITLISSSSQVTDNNIIGSFDTATFQNGVYTLKLTATDTSGQTYSNQVFDLLIDNDLVNGWPKSLGSPSFITYRAIPAIADINGDNRKEILIAVGNKLHAFVKDGTELPGFPILIPENEDFDGPINTDDLDGDGKKEIIVRSFQKLSYAVSSPLYVFRPDGTIYPGWPIILNPFTSRILQNGDKSSNGAVITDLNNNGTKEIVILEGAGTAGGTINLRVFALNGGEVAGFPKTLPIPQSDLGFAVAGISVIDLDKDGTKEILLGHRDKFYLFDNQGQLLPNWPKEVFSSGLDNGFDAPGTAGDLDGDGNLEVIALATRTDINCYLVVCPFLLYAWSKDGTSIPGWPQTDGTGEGNDYNYLNPPSIADIDNDGKDEAILNFGSLYIYDLEGRKQLPYTSTHGQVAPAVGDVDGDGGLEITASSLIKEENYIYESQLNNSYIGIVNDDGSTFWERKYPYPLYFDAPSLIADVDNNGNAEYLSVAVDFNNSMIAYLWELPNAGPVNSHYEWPQFMQNRERTGRLLTGDIVLTPTPTIVLQPTPTYIPTPTPKVTPTPTITLSPSPTPSPTIPLSDQLILNPGFEIDDNKDGKPDNWTGNSKFTRSKGRIHSGTYSGRHYSIENSNYNINQTVNNISANTSYSFSGWINIPDTSDSFNFKIQLVWKNSTGSNLRTDTLNTYTTSTGGWKKSIATKVAPSGARSVTVRMNVSSLNAMIFTDDFSFSQL